MKPRFTPSVDGIERCNLHVTVRVSRSLLAAIALAAAADQENFRTWLRHRLHEGIEAGVQRYQEDHTAAVDL